MTRRRALLVSLLLLALVATACGKKEQEETVQRPDIMGVVDTHAPRLIAISGVAAVAVGALDSGEPCVRIYVVELTDSLRAQLPTTLEGWPVDVEESGEIRPLGGT